MLLGGAQVALMFLTRGELPQARMWEGWLRAAAGRVPLSAVQAGGCGAGFGPQGCGSVSSSPVCVSMTRACGAARRAGRWLRCACPSLGRHRSLPSGTLFGTGAKSGLQCLAEKELAALSRDAQPLRLSAAQAGGCMAHLLELCVQGSRERTITCASGNAGTSVDMQDKAAQEMCSDVIVTSVGRSAGAAWLARVTAACGAAAGGAGAGPLSQQRLFSAYVHVGRNEQGFKGATHTSYHFLDRGCRGQKCSYCLSMPHWQVAGSRQHYSCAIKLYGSTVLAAM